MPAPEDTIDIKRTRSNIILRRVREFTRGVRE
jgi:hypothetical protein